MALVLAIEPDSKQAGVLKWVVERRLKCEFVLTDSREAAVAALDKRIPDLILVSALLSPRDEAEFSAHTRSLEGAEHLQTLTIPLLGSPDGPTTAPAAARGFFGAFRRRPKASAPAGCDPSAYADELKRYLGLALDERALRTARRQWAAKEQEAEVGTAVTTEWPVDAPADGTGVETWIGSSSVPQEAKPEALSTIGSQTAAVEALAAHEESAEPVADAFEMVEPIQAVGPGESIERIEPIEAVGPVESIETIEPIEAVGLAESIETIEPIEAVGLAESIETIKPIEIAEPIAPFEPAIQSVAIAEASGHEQTGEAQEITRHASVFETAAHDDLASVDPVTVTEPAVDAAPEVAILVDSTAEAAPEQVAIESAETDAREFMEPITLAEPTIDVAPPIEEHQESVAEEHQPFMESVAETASFAPAERTVEAEVVATTTPVQDEELPIHQSPAAGEWGYPPSQAIAAAESGRWDTPAEPSLDRVVEDLIRPLAASLAPAESITVELVDDPSLDPIVSRESARQIDPEPAPVERPPHMAIEAWQALPAWTEIGPPLESHISVGSKTKTAQAPMETVQPANAAPTPEPARESAPDAVAVDSRWIASALNALRSDIQMMRAERPATPPPEASAGAAASPLPSANAAQPDAAVKPGKAAVKPGKAAPARPRRKERQQPVQDEWGMYDPSQCGFEALFAAIDAKDEAEVESETEPAAADLLVNGGAGLESPVPAADQLVATPGRRSATVRLAPLAMWARVERTSDSESSTAPASTRRRDDLGELLAGLSIPVGVASVTYPTGCNIRRVRMTRDDQPRPPKAAEDPVIILSRRLLKKEREEHEPVAGPGRR